MDSRSKTYSWTIAIGTILVSMVWSASLVTQTVIIRYMIWAALTVLLLTIVLIKGRIDKKILKSPFFMFFGYYIIISGLSGLQASNFGEWLFDLTRIVLMGLFIYCVYIYLNREVFSKVIILMFLTLGVFSLWQVSLGADYTRMMMLGNMGNRHLFSLFALLVLPFCLSSKSKLGLLAAALVIVNILFLRIRTAWLALILSLFITALVFNRKGLVYAFVVLIIFGGVTVFTGRDVLNTESMQARFHNWKQTLKMTKDNLYVGGGNWKTAILPYSAGFHEEGIGLTYFYTESHNEYLQVLSEKSIVGLLIYLGIMIIALYYTVKHKKPFLFMGLVIWIVFSMFDNKNYAPHLLMLCIYFGLILQSHKEPQTEPFSRPALVLPVILMSFILFTWYQRFDIDYRLIKARHEIKCGNYDKAIEILEPVSVYATIERHTTPYLWFVGDAYKFKGDPQKAYEYFGKAYLCNPYNSFAIMSFAEMLFYSGEEKESVNLYKKALAICPKNKMARENLRRIYAKKEN